MTTKTQFHSSTALARPALMADMMRYGVAFQSEADLLPSNDPPKDPPKPKPTPAPAPEDPNAALNERLRRQVAELESKIAGFGGATPEEIAELRELRTKAQKDREEAEALRRAAEEEKLRRDGDYETLRQRMAEEHQRQLDAVRAESGALNETVAELTRRIEDMALGTAFASSRFVQEETIIGADKARRIYGAHFDVVDGRVVGYDAPRGSQKRVAFVGADGQPLPFDAAIKRLVESDEDRDRLLRSHQKPGPGTQPSPGVRPQPSPQPELRGAARLAQSLPKLLGR